MKFMPGRYVNIVRCRAEPRPGIRGKKERHNNTNILVETINENIHMTIIYDRSIVAIIDSRGACRLGLVPFAQ